MYVCIWILLQTDSSCRFLVGDDEMVDNFRPELFHFPLAYSLRVWNPFRWVFVPGESVHVEMTARFFGAVGDSVALPAPMHLDGKNIYKKKIKRKMHMESAHIQSGTQNTYTYTNTHTCTKEKKKKKKKKINIIPSTFSTPMTKTSKDPSFRMFILTKFLKPSRL